MNKTKFCYGCGATFSTEQECAAHKMSRAHHCPNCPSIYKSCTTLRKHTCKTEQVKCDECGAVLSATTSMKRHKKSHQNETRLRAERIKNSEFFDFKQLGSKWSYPMRGEVEVKFKLVKQIQSIPGTPPNSPQ